MSPSSSSLVKEAMPNSGIFLFRPYSAYCWLMRGAIGAPHRGEHAVGLGGIHLGQVGRVVGGADIGEHRLDDVLLAEHLLHRLIGFAARRRVPADEIDLLPALLLGDLGGRHGVLIGRRHEAENVRALLRAGQARQRHRADPGDFLLVDVGRDRGADRTHQLRQQQMDLVALDQRLDLGQPGVGTPGAVLVQQLDLAAGDGVVLLVERHA